MRFWPRIGQRCILLVIQSHYLNPIVLVRVICDPDAQEVWHKKGALLKRKKRRAMSNFIIASLTISTDCFTVSRF